MADYRTLILMRKYKSQGTGLLLTGILGGIGLFYSSFVGGLIVFAGEFIIGYIINENYYYIARNGTDALYSFMAKALFIFAMLRAAALVYSYSALKNHNDEIDKEIKKIMESEKKQ